MDGADPGVTLHAPKGSAVYGDRFYVADIDVVAVGADGTVYVTDTGIREPREAIGAEIAAAMAREGARD